MEIWRQLIHDLLDLCYCEDHQQMLGLPIEEQLKPRFVNYLDFFTKEIRIYSKQLEFF